MTTDKCLKSPNGEHNYKPLTILLKCAYCGKIIEMESWEKELPEFLYDDVNY